MERNRTSLAFEGVVSSGGTIRLPEKVLRVFPGGRGAKVHVRVTGRRVSIELQALRVSEEEIERIAGLQRESRDHVERFLLSEGSLGKRSRLARSSRRGKRRSRA